jgi:hypothetical protein
MLKKKESATHVAAFSSTKRMSHLVTMVEIDVSEELALSLKAELLHVEVIKIDVSEEPTTYFRLTLYYEVSK